MYGKRYRPPQSNRHSVMVMCPTSLHSKLVGCSLSRSSKETYFGGCNSTSTIFYMRGLFGLHFSGLTAPDLRPTSAPSAAQISMAPRLSRRGRHVACKGKIWCVLCTRNFAKQKRLFVVPWLTRGPLIFLSNTNGSLCANGWLEQRL